jgi:hypothetical protein
MHKKLIMACMAIAAFAAFVIAPAASASPVLTDKTADGTVHTLAVGASITGRNTGDTLLTGAFNVRCSTAHMTGTVTANTGSHIGGKVPAGGAQFTGTGTSGDCTSALGSVKVTVNSALCFTTISKTDTLTIDGCGAEISFTLEITGTGPCTYGVATIKGTFLTNAAATVNISEQESKLTSGGFFCPGSGKLDMDFDLYTTGATPGGEPGIPVTVS